MRWFRDHIKQGSWLALAALVINFGLVFGHVHGADGAVARVGSTLVATVATPAGQANQGQPTDTHPDYLCPICLAAAALGSALATDPPALAIEFAATRTDRVIVSELSGVPSPQAAFQSRGPPIS
jgi:hypothetical protein